MVNFRLTTPKSRNTGELSVRPLVGVSPSCTPTANGSAAAGNNGSNLSPNARLISRLFRSESGTTKGQSNFVLDNSDTGKTLSTTLETTTGPDDSSGSVVQTQRGTSD